MRPLTRVAPLMGAMSYKTFALSQPLATHFRQATCEEARCAAFLAGWSSTFDEKTDLGQRQAYYVRKGSGRKFTEHRNEAGLTVFVFEAGQQCFDTSRHRIHNGREANHYTFNGDFRVKPRRDDIYLHKRPEDWQDDFASHQDRIKTTLERG